MIEVIPFESLGRFDNDWLSARYHFSFANYYDPERRGLGPLLVWNDDTIQPGKGFDLHGHRDMEIITYVREGAITHQDHLGNRGRTEAGDVQVMKAGKGILHAEHNLEAEPTKIFQIWIQPRRGGGEPHWETQRFPKAERSGELVALASGEPGRGGLEIDQDAAVLGATLEAGQAIDYPIGRERMAYLVLAGGRVQVNGQDLGPRDGAIIREQESLHFEAGEPAELLLVELAAEH